MDMPSVPLPSPETNTEDFISAPEAARVVGLSRSTFYRWIRHGYLPHHRFGKTVRLNRVELLAFIEKNRSWAAPPGWDPDAPAAGIPHRDDARKS